MKVTSQTKQKPITSQKNSKSLFNRIKNNAFFINMICENVYHIFTELKGVILAWCYLCVYHL